MKRSWTSEIKKIVRELRQSGATYSEIQKKFGVPKSTLNTWFKDLPYPAHEYFIDQKSWLIKIRKLSAESKKKKSAENMRVLVEKIRNDVKSWEFLISKDIQKCLLAILYWAEGQKLPENNAPVNFANTDPKLILLFLTMLRNCYTIDESKLRVRLHVHWYHNIKIVKRFWGNLLNIDEKKFGKVFIKPRSKTKKFRKNFAGICFVIYHSVYLRREIVQTGYNIAESITGKIPVYTP